jgi:hypothetical protein
VSDDLIGRLSQNQRPVPRLAVARRLLAGTAAGVLVSTALIVVTLGLRPDLGRAVGQTMFWVKLAYVASLAGLALWACERLARPAGTARGRIGWIAAPVVALAAAAGWQLFQASEAARMPLLIGHSASLCPWLILAFSLPPLVGLVWAARGLAPTRLALTGLMIGLAAGGVGACAYCLHCDEMSAPFLAVWYTLGVAGAGALGWIAGPRILRW